MNLLQRLLLEHWLAKIASLVLAISLWAVIKKSIQNSSTPAKARLEAERKFQFRTPPTP